MAQLIDITKVEVGPRNLEACVRVIPGAPLMTSEDIEATALVYNVMPHIADHACTGDAGSEFKDAMGNTEIAHLLEHVAVELMARAGSDGEIVCGRTRRDDSDPRAFVIQLACPDDVLAIAALSSAAWIIDWAFTGGDGPVPDVDAIASGIAQLAAEAPIEEPEEDAQEEPSEPEPSEPADAEPAAETEDAEADQPVVGEVEAAEGEATEEPAVDDEPVEAQEQESVQADEASENDIADNSVIDSKEELNG